jgi:flavin-dependent dehydrogenase
MTQFDAIVIGARVAGSPTAMLLARRGYRVLLVDRATFPSDTISTHLIHPRGVAALARWGLADAVAATHCPPIQRYRLDFGPFAIVGRPAGVAAAPTAFAPRRMVLDELLVDAAGQAGAEVREGFTVDGLVIEAGTVTGIRGHSTGSPSVVERARVVIGADGASSLVARAVDAPRYVDVPAFEALYLAYWSGLPTDGEYQLYARERRGLAAVPTNDGLTVALVAWPMDEFEANRRDLLGNYLRAFEADPAVADRIRGATRESKPVGAVMRNFYRQSNGPGWALVGDAGYHKDAVTAQGISDAFLDAESLVDAIDEAFSGRRPWDVTMAARQDARDRRTRAMFELTCQFASMDPPSEESAQLFAAVAADPRASEDFVSTYAGSMAVEDFFAPANLERYATAPVA